MYIFVIVVCTLIFAAWLFYEHRKAARLDRQISDDFWAREEEANRTRKKDISGLPLHKVDESEIPAAAEAGEDAAYYIEQLKQIIQQPMIDLSEYSNTDLKIAYGVGNFKILSDYDENFNNFLINLSNLARHYERSGHFEAARDTYLMALRHGSLKLSDYKELAAVYLKLDQPEQVSRLIRDVGEGEHPRRESVVAELREVLATYR